MSQDETPNELDAWLLRHGFTRQETTNGASQTPKSVFEVVHELCDCVQNLYSLEFQDLINAGLKVGVTRTLLATIKSENENVKQLCALAEPKNPQQIIVAQTPILESSVDGRKQYENPKVLMLLSLSNVRIIFGRSDPTLTLTTESSRLLGVAAKKRILAPIRYVNAVNYRMARSVKRLGSANVNSHCMLAVNRGNDFIRSCAITIKFLGFNATIARHQL
jgi:hypothetical protein